MLNCINTLAVLLSAARVEQEMDGRLFTQTFPEHINSHFGTWLQHAKRFCRALPPVSTAEEYLRRRGSLAATILPFWTAVQNGLPEGGPQHCRYWIPPTSCNSVSTTVGSRTQNTGRRTQENIKQVTMNN